MSVSILLSVFLPGIAHGLRNKLCFKFEYSHITQYNFLALPNLIGQLLLYPLVFVATPGNSFFFCTNSCQTACIFGSLTLCHNKVSRSKLRSRHNFTVRPARRSALDVMLSRDGSVCGGQPTIQYRPPRRSRGGRYWMVGCLAAHWAVAGQHGIQWWAPRRSYGKAGRDRRIEHETLLWQRDRDTKMQTVWREFLQKSASPG